jgi:hypothetical protein
MSGIRLLTLFEDEWIERRSVVESMIRHASKSTTNTIYARKCTISTVSSAVAKQFFERTHLQGAPGNIRLAVGLFHDGALVACMSFSNHHRTGTGVILQRMSFELNTSIVGGASKMLNFAEQHTFCKGKEIITWSDGRYSSGDVYSKLGFVKCGIVPADYHYVKGQRRFPKQRFQKRFTGCPPEITEREHAQSNGYARIWDCGKTKWVKSLQQ